MIYTDTKNLMLYLKQLKVGRDVNNKELASRLNCSQGAISGLFSQTNITVEKLKAICNALDYDIDITFVDKNGDTTK